MRGGSHQVLHNIDTFPRKTHRAMSRPEHHGSDGSDEMRDGATPDAQTPASHSHDEAAHDDREQMPMPSPWVAAVAVLALLAFGVLLGSVSGSGVKRRTVLLAASPSQSSASTGGGSTPSTSAAGKEEAEAEEAEAPEAEEEAGEEEAGEEEPGGEEESEGEESSGKGEGAGSEAEEEAGPKAGSEGSARKRSAPSSAPPSIKHVFVVMLANEGYEATFGPRSQAPYLAKTLRGEGELLENYYGVASGELANEIALVSGQGPTTQTTANCPLYESLAPGTKGAEGQALGSGCVYPAGTLTIGDQLTTAGKTWKAYIGGLGEGAAAECRHPALGAADPNAAPNATEPYVTWRNPFAYFDSVIESPSCAKDYVDLGKLASDLKSSASTPNLSYISPDVCEDGSPEPCASGKAAGLQSAEAFLRKVVPEIEASPAYKEGGLIAITSDEAPQSGPHADSSSCCISPKYPNLTAQASSSGAASTTATATTSTSLTATTGAATTLTTTTTSAATTSTATSTTTSTATTSTTAPTGGGRVGLLLISKYVKPGSIEVGTYNHYSLLLSIEKLFKLHPLGYAGAVGLLSFSSGVYNARR